MQSVFEFEGPVHQVAGQSIHNTHHHHHTAAPGPDAEAVAIRECPQCKRATWALTQHCHHCRLDLAMFDRRKAWQVRRRVILAVLGVSMVLLLPQWVHAAPAVNKAAAEQLVRDMDSVHYGLYTALTRPDELLPMARKVHGFGKRVEALFGVPAMHAPFSSCAMAATQSYMMWSGAASMARSGKAAPADAAVLARSSFLFGEAYRRCRTEVDALK